MSYMSKNLCVFIVSNVSVLNFRTVPLMYPGSLSGWCAGSTDIRAGGRWMAAAGAARQRPAHRADDGEVARAGQGGVVQSEQHHGHVHQHTADRRDAVQLRTGELHLSARHTRQTHCSATQPRSHIVTQPRNHITSMTP